MRVLLTGASGNLGHAVLRLLEHVDDVEPIIWISPRSDPRATGARIDLARTHEIQSAVRDARPDAIIHLAAITGAACERDPVLARQVNADATRTLAAAAADLGATRFVFASTSALYGDAYDEPVSESAPLVGESDYASTKRVAEERLASLVGSVGGLECLALRVFNIFGPEFPDSLVSRLLWSTPTDPVALRGPDNFVRDYVRSDDVAQAMIAALTAPLTAPFAPVNIGTGVPTSNRDLVDIVTRRRPVFFTTLEGPRSYSCADIATARELLAFNPRSLGAADEEG